MSLSLNNIEQRIIDTAKIKIAQGNRTAAFYLFKSLMVLQPLKIIKNIGRRNPSFIGFLCTVALLLISISAILTLWIPEGVLSSEVVKGQSQCCDMVVALYDKRGK